MEKDWLVIFLGLLLGCVMYMLVPIILRIKNGCYEEDKAKKIALWNSIIIFVIDSTLVMVLFDATEFKPAPAVLYYFLNFALLTYDNKKNNLDKDKTKKNQNNVGMILLIIIGVIIMLDAVITMISNSSIENTNFEQEPVDERMRARHILVEDYKTAKAVIALLNSGTDFCELVYDYSEDTATINECGDVGYFEEGEFVIEFEEAVKNLNYNEYATIPIRSDYGYHVIMRIK